MIEGVRVNVGTRVLVGGTVRVGEGKTVGKLTASAVGSGGGVEVQAVRINTSIMMPIILVKVLVLEYLGPTLHIIFDPLIAIPTVKSWGMNEIIGIIVNFRHPGLVIQILT